MLKTRWLLKHLSLSMFFYQYFCSFPEKAQIPPLNGPSNSCPGYLPIRSFMTLGMHSSSALFRLQPPQAPTCPASEQCLFQLLGMDPGFLITQLKVKLEKSLGVRVCLCLLYICIVESEPTELMYSALNPT